MIKGNNLNETAYLCWQCDNHYLISYTYIVIIRYSNLLIKQLGTPSLQSAHLKLCITYEIFNNYLHICVINYKSRVTEKPHNAESTRLFTCYPHILCYNAAIVTYNRLSASQVVISTVSCPWPKSLRSVTFTYHSFQHVPLFFGYFVQRIELSCHVVEFTTIKSDYLSGNKRTDRTLLQA